MDEDAILWWLLEWLSRNLTPGDVLGVILALLLAVATVALVAALALVAFRRHPKVRRAVLRLRAEHLASGLEADVIDLRLDLHDELARARRAVASLDTAGALAGDLPDLLQRLEQAADRLDRYLRVLERSPEDGAAYRAVVAARRRVADVVVAARDIRRAALAALDVTSTGEISDLTRDVEREVAWVQTAVEAMDGLLESERAGAQEGRGRRRHARSR